MYVQGRDSTAAATRVARVLACHVTEEYPEAGARGQASRAAEHDHLTYDGPLPSTLHGASRSPSLRPKR